MTDGPDADSATRYQLDVIAPRLADVVEHAGGWLFDHVMSGWDVTALLPECADPRPLHILGVRVMMLDGGAAGDNIRAANTIGVCATTYRDDANIARQLDRAIRHGSEVVLWPGDPNVQSVPAVGQKHHRLTRAARVFKAEALRALNVRRDPDSVEWFQCLTCNAAALSTEPGLAFVTMPRRAFNCSSPVPALDRSESLAMRSIERRAL